MTEARPPTNVLFLCTGNSARSILAECIIERVGGGKFHGFSAGSHPKGEIHPFALDLLRRRGFSTGHLRSTGWAAFAAPGAPEMDFIFTVCDNAAVEVCPIWPGRPVSAHWGLPDPAAAGGSDADRRRAFEDAMRVLTRRIERFVALPLAGLDRAALMPTLNEIGGLAATRGTARITVDNSA